MLELRKDIFADERDDNLKEIGKGTQRQDMLGHVTATSTYFNDHLFQGMLHLKVLRSPHAHARLRRIDVAEAERMPGVRRVIRGADVPLNKNTLLSLINFGKDDEPTLAVDKVRYKGEPIVRWSPTARARRSRRSPRSRSTTSRCRPSTMSRTRSSPARRWSTRPIQKHIHLS